MPHPPQQSRLPSRTPGLMASLFEDSPPAPPQPQHYDSLNLEAWENGVNRAEKASRTHVDGMAYILYRWGVLTAIGACVCGLACD